MSILSTHFYSYLKKKDTQPTATNRSTNEPSITKKISILPTMESWSSFLQTTEQFERQGMASESGFAFEFIEGAGRCHSLWQVVSNILDVLLVCIHMDVVKYLAFLDSIHLYVIIGYYWTKST